MGGGPADQSQAGADPRPAALQHPRESPPPRLLQRKMASLPIPDELLAEILLRLPTPADLIRASAACVSFRRVTADRSFLRRFRKLHAPPFLGFLEQELKVFLPAVPPHPSAPEASATALAADFSFSFLPAPASDWLWLVRDVRDGRVLLDRAPQDINKRYRVVFPELVICDPLHRRYLLLPPIPAHLTATVERSLWTRLHPCETFLAHPGDEESLVEETTFSVVWMARCRTKLVAFVFSSSTGQWRAVSSQRWPSATGVPLISWGQYAYGCFYWVTGCSGKLLVLDIPRMEFSIAETPPEAIDLHGADIAFVEAGEGRLGMFVLPSSGYDLSYFIRQKDGLSSGQWQKVKTISLCSGTSLICNMGKYLVLNQDQSSPMEAGCFTLDIETFQYEKVSALGSNIYKVHAYCNFPPSLLSSPKIPSGIPQDAEKPMLEQDTDVLPAESHSHHDQNTSEASAPGGQAGVSRIGDDAD